MCTVGTLAYPETYDSTYLSHLWGVLLCAYFLNDGGLMQPRSMFKGLQTSWVGLVCRKYSFEKSLPLSLASLSMLRCKLNIRKCLFEIISY